MGPWVGGAAAERAVLALASHSARTRKKPVVFSMICRASSLVSARVVRGCQKAIVLSRKAGSIDAMRVAWHGKLRRVAQRDIWVIWVGVGKNAAF